MLLIRLILFAIGLLYVVFAQGYVTVFSDDFSGAALDNGYWKNATFMRALYDCIGNPLNPGSHLPYAVFNPANTYVSGGLMHIATRYEPDYYSILPWKAPTDDISTDFGGCTGYVSNQQWFDFTTGAVQSRFRILTGSTWWKAKMPHIKGFWPALWMDASYCTKSDNKREVVVNRHSLNNYII